MALNLRRVFLHSQKAAMRQMSTEAPKVTIARNILFMQRVAEAKDEAALQKIALPNVDLANLPTELSSMSGYLSLTAAAASTEKFTADPTAWQNMDFAAFAATEAQRTETWPFLLGFVFVFVALGYGIGSSVPESARKNSKYVQYLERARGNGDHGHGHGHGHGHEETAHAHH